MDNLLSDITKLHKEYNFILNYPIEVARKTPLLKNGFQASISNF